MEGSLELSDQDEAVLICGPQDRNLRLLRDRLGVEVYARDLKVTVRGEEQGAARALHILGELRDQARRGGLPPGRLEELLEPLGQPGGKAGTSGRHARGGGSPASAGDEGSLDGVRLRTPGQRRYAAQMRRDALVFAIGPAGTGKTFLAVAMAVKLLKAGEVQRIVLCRPAVEAGERLGFLPGDLQAKVNPYMRPLYDALYALIDFDTVKRYIEREVIEVAPLAYMRGRTLSSSFIILDEAQNTTKAQMRMFLTRMGEGSRIVVTGDVTQVDLPKGVTSGLVHAQSILRQVPGIGFVELKAEDVVRHELVARLIEAYEGTGQGGRRRGGAAAPDRRGGAAAPDRRGRGGE